MTPKLASMGAPSVTLNPTRPRTRHGYVKVPAPPFEFCPKCQSANTDAKFVLFRVADTAGARLECDVCANVEIYPEGRSQA